jgi:hypothetical protein
VRLSYEIEFTRNSITIGSFAFSLRLARVTVSETVAPAGITAPFEPLTGDVRRAVNVSPSLCVLVQTCWLAARFSVVPAAIVPTAPPPPPLLPRVTVLPLDVRTGVDGVRGAGLRAAGRAAGVVGRRAGVEARGAGVAAAFESAGTSASCGCAAVSRPASSRSRFKAESWARGESAPPPLPRSHAASTSAADSTAAALRCRVYFAMRPLRVV